jgi:hypothetical protein
MTRPPLTVAQFRELVAEGQRLRWEYERRTAPKRWLTAADLAFRVR